MSFFGRIYITLAALTALFIASPSIAVIVTIFTVGLPFLITGAIVYLTALWPAVWLHRAAYKRAWLVAITSLAGMALVPGLVSRV